jgi:hypothetical protein
MPTRTNFIPLAKKFLNPGQGAASFSQRFRLPIPPHNPNPDPATKTAQNTPAQKHQLNHLTINSFS